MTPSLHQATLVEAELEAGQRAHTHADRDDTHDDTHDNSIPSPEATLLEAELEAGQRAHTSPQHTPVCSRPVLNTRPCFLNTHTPPHTHADPSPSVMTPMMTQATLLEAELEAGQRLFE